VSDCDNEWNVEAKNGNAASLKLRIEKFNIYFVKIFYPQQLL